MNVIVVGPKGKMGRAITRIAEERSDMTLLAGVGPKGRAYIGQDIGEVAMLGKSLGKPIVDDLEAVIEDCDVIIDFSTKETALQVLALAKQYRTAVVCGTTGFSEEEMQQFKKAGEHIPVLYAANTSKLVNLMNQLLKLAANTIGDQTDIEIVEMHDRTKKDAPSGTSKEMGEIIAEELGKKLKNLAVYGREGRGEREEGTIGYHSMRLGDTPSSHTVYFGGVGERLEISHHATDFSCFASGACDAAVYLAKQQPGFYSMADVVSGNY
ncbi:4-hydroxy-tetrahydrodipicolinate reductase [Enterococcus florum]|uniref:4-hydroxy-tetrahydrodipicolinate reductase n=1 Tax=Enterococcus florum TaxID=2480627 RepID=A0A4P5PGH4_9ENTE|nr:4-hydroxy-tetrahydrodipicolinate reductase [Enterococcus florum]GCF95398.1 4-hydroxy-tetrahydrodipicolinate reductase [Enterococcus florum]